MNVVVVGMGYVGLVTGACLSHFGNRVFCFDLDSAKIDKLNNGILPIYEKGLKELIQAGTKSGLLLFTSDPASVSNHPDVIIIAVGTPPLATGEPDLSGITSAAKQIGSWLNRQYFTVIVNKSTAPVGTCGMITRIIQSEPANVKEGCFAVISNPEFLREGSAVSDTLYPSRIVVGASSQPAVEIISALYRPITEQSFDNTPLLPPKPQKFQGVELIVTTPVNAEMIKYASNAFLAAKISFINDIANICERIGADVAVIARGMGLDPRIGKDFLKAGIGWGGSCFGKDIAALLHTARKNNYFPELIDAVVNVNKRQRLAVISKLEETTGDLRGRTIGLLGLAFKPNTNDLRDAPSIFIIKKLIEKGAKVKVYDPAAMENCKTNFPELNVNYEKSAVEAAEEADALIIVTDWEEFGSLDADKLKAVMRKAVIIDGRNILNPVKLVQKGFIYKGIGK
jgi:UDPglucose 6-dehydrogenase